MPTNINFDKILGIPGNTSITIKKTVVTCPDVDAAAFLSATGITDPTISTAVCDLVVALKTNSLWNEMITLYPYVGNTAFTSKFNLKNPLDTDAAFRLTFVGGWTFAADGATPNGTNAYANTHLDPSINLNNTDLATWGYFSKTSTGFTAEYVMGVSTVLLGGIQLIARRDTNLQYALSDFSSVTFRGASNTLSTDGSGFLIGTQQGTNAKLFKNGTLLASNTFTRTNQVIPTGKVYLGALNLNGTAANFTNKRCVFSFISKKLTDSQIVTLNTIVQTFQTALGR